MNDRELLDMTAKAMDESIVFYGECWRSMNGCEWNPLLNDGDALKLAVKLEITLSKHDDTIVASRSASWRNGATNFSLWETSGDDPYAATRRAIVRAAAEIWKSIP